jgi:hypothetical protein
VPVDVDRDLGVDPDGDRVAAARVDDAPQRRRRRVAELVQALVELAPPRP